MCSELRRCREDDQNAGKNFEYFQYLIINLIDQSLNASQIIFDLSQKFLYIQGRRYLGPDGEIMAAIKIQVKKSLYITVDCCKNFSEHFLGRLFKGGLALTLG